MGYLDDWSYRVGERAGMMIVVCYGHFCVHRKVNGPSDHQR